MALNPVQRLDLEDQLMGLIARCLILQHPHRERMTHVTIRQAMALSDDRLVALNERLSAWIAEHEPSALPAPAEVAP